MTNDQVEKKEVEKEKIVHCPYCGTVLPSDAGGVCVECDDTAQELGIELY